MVFSPVALVLFWAAAFGLAWLGKTFVRRFAGWNFIALMLVAVLAQSLALGILSMFAR